MSIKRKVFMALICATVTIGCLSGLSACGKKSDESAKNTEEQTTEEETEEATETDSTLRSLLTNEPVEDASLVENRPIAIMYENTKAALPHYGISQAGIVYQATVEGSITRIMALFDDYSGLDKIGCVRSARPYYAYLASEYNAIYVHFGQSINTEGLLTSFSGHLIEDINFIYDTHYYRDNSRQAPHNAYTSSELIDQAIESKGFDRKQSADYQNGHFLFAEEENTLEDGEDCVVLTTYYPHDEPWFVYDEDTKTYARYEFGAPHVDQANGQQLTFTNVIYMNVHQELYPGDKGYLNIPIAGASGTGKFFTRGKMVDIMWVSGGDAQVTHYYYMDGTEIQLNTGKTFISLIQNEKVDDNHFYATYEDYEANK